MGLKALLRSGVAAACIATVGLPAQGQSSAPVAPPARSPVEVKVAQASDFSRVEFHWAGGAEAASRRQGQVLTLRFNRSARPDMAQLKVFPPKWLKSTEAAIVRGALEVKFTLTDDADAKVGKADGAIFVNIFPKRAVGAAPPVPVAPVVKRPDPVPDGGVVRVAQQSTAGRSALAFPWKAPLGAAVFRRGEAVWVVFDAKARLDLTHVARTAQIADIKLVQGVDFSALRLIVPLTTPVSAVGEGPLWTVTLGPTVVEKPAPVRIRRDAEATHPALSAAVAGATRVVWIDDPAVGDRLVAVTALAPSKGLASRREFVEMALLPSAQGLGIEPFASDLAVASEGDLVRFDRPAGMALSPLGAGPLGVGGSDGPKAASMPALIDFAAWSDLHGMSYYERYDQLSDAAAEEMAVDKPLNGQSPQIEARMALARFLVGSELSYEAIGVLNLLAKSHPSVLSNAEFRGLRGAAKVMARRYAEAQTDFAAPVLAGEPSSSLWRGLIATRLGQFADARRSFSMGYQALGLFDADWKARFAVADAEAALALADLPVARTQIAAALAAKPKARDELYVRLVQARLFEAQGDRARALAVYDVLARDPLGYLASPAILRATQIRLEDKAITPAQAVHVFDGLRYRWRGDSTELETIRLLGQLYLDKGDYRGALEAWRSAGERLPDLPQAAQLQADQLAAFRALFLDGQADGLQPIQAVALFFDFKELTPIGTDGDLMARKLARRLVDVDLLDKAAELYKHQMENRLDGVPKAQVATDLALVYLMDRKPEQALVAINSSRTTVLPNAMNAERRLITARALMALGRFDQALEFLENDRSAEAGEIRAEVAWRRKDWKTAGPIFERALGDRWKLEGPLSPVEEARLLRTSVAFSLAGDDTSLARLRLRYEGFVQAARAPDALRIALSGMDVSKISSADFTRAVADNESFAAWVAGAKKRIRDRPGLAQAASPAKQAAAPLPAAAAKG